MADSSTDVLVVGAGPVGLLMAAELRRHGARCRVIDKLPEPMAWVKALGVSQRTLEVWDDLGIVTEAMDAGLTARRQRVFVNRESVVDADVAFPGEAPYRYPLLLTQPETERILAGHLARLGTHVERGVELRSFVADADGVRATLATANGGEEVLRCRYLAGCDGAHSTVRQQLQLPFEGGRFPTEFLLADVQVDWEFSHATSCLFLEVREDRLENLLVCIPYRDPSSRGRPRYRLSTMARPVSEVDWEGVAAQTTPAEEPATKPTLDQVREMVRHFVPVPAEVSELRWSSIFRISHRIVPRYRVGRVFLAGDAAHIHPPTGGQGMNTGLQDAYNLAWKLALDLKGLAHPTLLDSYDAERRPVGEAVVERTRQRSMSFGDRSQQNNEQALRDDAQLCVDYRGTGWVLEGQSQPGGAPANGPQSGDRAPDVPALHRDGTTFPVRLFDLLRGTHHTLLVYDAASPDRTGTNALAEVTATLRSRYGDQFHTYRIVPPEEAASPAGDETCPTLVDSERHFQRLYGAAVSTAYLVRPDGYIGFRTDALNRSALDRYLERVFRP